MPASDIIALVSMRSPYTTGESRLPTETPATGVRDGVIAPSGHHRGISCISKRKNAMRDTLRGGRYRPTTASRRQLDRHQHKICHKRIVTVGMLTAADVEHAGSATHLCMHQINTQSRHLATYFTHGKTNTHASPVVSTAGQGGNSELSVSVIRGTKKRGD